MWEYETKAVIKHRLGIGSFLLERDNSRAIWNKSIPTAVGVCCAENGNGLAIKGAWVPSQNDRTSPGEGSATGALKIVRDHVHQVTVICYYQNSLQYLKKA